MTKGTFTLAIGRITRALRYQHMSRADWLQCHELRRWMQERNT